MQKKIVILYDKKRIVATPREELTVVCAWKELSSIITI